MNTASQCTPATLSCILKDVETKGQTLNISIEQFLAQVEKKAYRMAEIATSNQQDALDIVQETMIKLVEKYSNKTAEEWKPLFYKILQSKIMDHFRKQKLYRKFFFWKNYHHENGYQQSDYHDNDYHQQLNQACDFISPERDLIGQQNVHKVTQALKQLSVRQQQCFMLRSWEGLNVSETAKAMNCSQGSVKTHYSRAKESLMKALNDE